MKKREFFFLVLVICALSAEHSSHAAKELKLVARYNYSPEGQLQSVITPVSDTGAVKTTYSRSYMSDGKVKVSVHKKNLEFPQEASLLRGAQWNAKHSEVQGSALLASAGDRGGRSKSEMSSFPSHDYREEYAVYQVASAGNVGASRQDKGILVREYIERAGRKLEETDMLGTRSVFVYNDKGQLVRIVSEDSDASASVGQGRGALVAGRGDRATSETLLSYDRFGRLVKTEDSLGRVTARVYDPEGRVAEMVNPLGEKSETVYDKYGRVVARKGAGSYPLSFEYNSFGEIVAYTDGNGSTTKFDYDNAGRLVRRIWPDGTPVVYSYNDRGLLEKKTEADRTTVYSYDDFNRLVKILITNASASAGQGRGALVASAGDRGSRSKSETRLSYNSSGKLIEIADENGKVSFTYDSFGRVTSETGEIGVIKYEYNNRGLLSAKECMFSRKGAEAQSFKTEYSYDNFDRIVRVSSPAGVYSYTYDSKGRIASLSYSSSESTTSSTFTVKNTYDSAGRLFSKTFNAGGNKTQLAVYEYDKLDRIVKSEVNGNHWQYSYDELGQLISAKSAELGNYEYAYDKIGNRLKDKIQLASREFSYNNLNQIANQGFEYDAYGNLVKTPDAKYKYDLHNRLVEVEKPGITVKYSYDPLGQRIKSEEIATNGTKITKFLMSGMIEQARMESPLPLGEGKGEGGVAMFHTLGLDLAGSLTATGAVGAVLSSTTYNLPLPMGEGNGEGVMSQHYLYDGNGNIIAATDSSGAITEKLAYSPFGEQLSGPNLPFTFSTKAVDVSGLSYYGFRFYNPEIGRWMSRDSIGDKLVNLSLFFSKRTIAKAIWNYINRNEQIYNYCLNNTLVNFDFIGLSTCPSWGDYWSQCMTECGMPIPSGVFDSVGAVAGVAAAIANVWNTYGATVTVAELVGAGLASEWLAVFAGGMAAYWAGNAIGCASTATGKVLADKILGCCD